MATITSTTPFQYLQVDHRPADVLSFASAPREPIRHSRRLAITHPSFPATPIHQQRRKGVSSSRQTHPKIPSASQLPTTCVHRPSQKTSMFTLPQPPRRSYRGPHGSPPYWRRARQAEWALQRAGSAASDHHCRLFPQSLPVLLTWVALVTPS